VSAVARSGPGRRRAQDELQTTFKGLQAALRRLRGRDTHRPGELSFAQYHLLFGLAEAGELSAGELASTAGLAPATVTQMLDGLAAMGLVERLRSDRDRRIVTCVLTERGRAAVTERHEQVGRRWDRALSGFDASELAVAGAVLERLREMFDELDAEARPKPVEPVP
jgi:DNA-binding MarR family transcriptional regulator